MKELKLLKAKLEQTNWECLSEALKLLAIFLILWVALFQVAYAEQVIDQPQHNRVIVFEGWTGGVIKSTYDEVIGELNIEYCASADSTCDRIIEPLTISEIKTYDVALTMNLQTLRNEMANEIDQSFWKFIGGDSSSNPDIQTLDALISDLQVGGIRKLVLLTDENIRVESPAVSSPEVAERLVEAMKKGLGSF